MKKQLAGWFAAIALVGGVAFAQMEQERETRQAEPEQQLPPAEGGSGTEGMEGQTPPISPEAEPPAPQDPASQQMPQTEAGTGGAGMMDMSKMGPWTRKPTNVTKTKREILSFFKQEDQLMKKGDMNAMLDRMDFPVFMATDDSKGTPHAMQVSRTEYQKMMQPMFENMPKDMKVTHKPTITVLSDSLATYSDDFAMTSGGKTMRGTSSGLLVKRDGQWKWKAMIEAGWGDAEMSGVGGAGEGGEGSGQPTMPGTEGAEQGSPQPEGSGGMNHP